MFVENPPPDDDLETGRLLARRGQIADALRLLESVAGTDPLTSVVALSGVLGCRLARGELGAAARAAELLRPHLDEPGLSGALARVALGDLAWARGDHEIAATRYADAGRLLADDPAGPDSSDDPDLVPWRCGAAMALTRLGHRREAADLVAVHLELSRRRGSAYALAQALRTAAATNHDGQGLALLREARTVLAEVTAERLGAQIDADLAVLLTLQGDPASVTEAVELLRRAEEYAGREDLFPLQDRVRRLLMRLGEQPRRIRSETLASLTATEQKAAGMAAQGMTNREIAGQLAVTVKAVEWHLSHVYRKLGIRNRSSLADTLGAPV